MNIKEKLLSTSAKFQIVYSILMLTILSLIDQAVDGDWDDLMVRAEGELFFSVARRVEHVRQLAELLVGALLIVESL